MTGNEATECSSWFPSPGPPVGSALPFTGSSEASSPASTVLWRCATPCAPLAALRCLRLAIPCVAPVVRSQRPRTPDRGPGVRQPVPTPGNIRREASRASQVPRQPLRPFALFFDPGRTRHTRPIRCAGTAPAMSTTKAPTTIYLSGLHSTALGLLFTLRPVCCHTRRKTRFRSLAKLSRTGLITRRVAMKGFRASAHSPFRNFPGARTS